MTKGLAGAPPRESAAILFRGTTMREQRCCSALVVDFYNFNITGAGGGQQLPCGRHGEQFCDFVVDYENYNVQAAWRQQTTAVRDALI